MVLMAVLAPALLQAETAANLLIQGHADEAIASLESTTKNSPDDAAAHNLLCRAYYSIGKWDRSISACEKAVALDGNNSMYHLWLGRAYGEKADDSSVFSAPGWAKKTHLEFETAVRLDPSNVEARSDLSEYYVDAPGFMGGGTDKAEAQAQALEKLAPAKAHLVRAEIAQKNKDMDSAEREYRAAIEASKGSASAWFDLASFFHKAGRPDDMDKALNEAIAAAKTEPDVLVDSASLLIKAERNCGLAIQILHRYLDSEAKSEAAPAFKADYLLGTALEKQGNKQAAAEAYSAALALARDFTPAQEGLKRVTR